MKHNPTLFAYSFDAKGSARKLEYAAISQELKSKELSWVHLDAANKSTKKWLESEVGYLDHLIIDALTAEETRPRIAEIKDGLLIILRGVASNKEARPEEMISLRMWIDAERIITMQHYDMKAVDGLRQNLESGKLIKNSGEFLYNLLYEILSDISSFLYGFDERLCELEDKITKTHDESLRENVLQIRTQSAIFKRYLSPQREVIAKLRVCDCEWIGSWAKRHFQENLDQVTHMIEEVDEARDRSKILNDELANAIAERINSSMYKLSLIASIFLPLTFFTSIFSVNIGGVPGVGSDGAFGLMMAAMVVMCVVQIVLLKRKKMFCFS